MNFNSDDLLFKRNNFVFLVEWIICMLFVFALISVVMHNIVITIICGVLYLKPGLTMFKTVYFLDKKIMIKQPFSIVNKFKQESEYSYDELLKIAYYKKAAPALAGNRIELYFVNDRNVFSKVYRKMFYSFQIFEKDEMITFINEMESRGVIIEIND